MDLRKYKTIDLFSGIGGIRKGYELTERFVNVLSADVDKYACCVYKHLYGEDSYNDVHSNKFKKEVEKTKYDVLLAGFPCQAFSIAGLKKGFLDETRGTLFFDIADILKKTQPVAFMLENVEGLLKHDKGNTFTIIAKTLNEIGYKIVDVDFDLTGEPLYETSNLIHSAKDYGIPQKRARVIIMGFRKDIVPKNYVFPHLPKKGNEIIYNNLYELIEDKVGPKYYLSQQLLDALKRHKTYHKEAKSGFGYIIVNQGDNPVSNTIMATGGSGKERNLILQYYPEYDGLKISSKGPLNHEGIRYMTPIEWGKLQGFINYAFVDSNGVDCFSFPDGISDTQRYKLFGNSVCIPEMKTMAQYMADRLDEFYGIK